MKFAAGILHWNEQEFWSASFPYFRAAIEGRAIATGSKKVHGKPPSRSEYEAAKAALAERDRKRAKALTSDIRSGQNASAEG